MSASSSSRLSSMFRLLPTRQTRTQMYVMIFSCSTPLTTCSLYRCVNREEFNLLQLYVRSGSPNFNKRTPNVYLGRQSKPEQRQHGSNYAYGKKKTPLLSRRRKRRAHLSRARPGIGRPETEAQISALPWHADPVDAGRSSSLPVPAEPRTGE